MGATIVVDLGYGDSGKGTMVDYLTGELNAKTIIKFSGGPQNAHNVVANGIHHMFSQIGSGSLHPNVKTLVSKYCYVDPIAMFNEAKSLESKGHPVWDRLWIDKECLITTPYHAALNRMKEIKRGADRHGSCGVGINETVTYGEYHWNAPRIKHILDEEALYTHLKALQTYALEILYDEDLTISVIEKLTIDPKELVDRYRWCKNNIWWSNTIQPFLKEEVIFEGSQGILLDEWYGFYPYVTRSHTTSRNAEELLVEQGYTGSVSRVGVLRSYMTRHGAGPLVTEDDMHLNEVHNGTGKWQGAFRTGHLDLMALKLAIRCNTEIDSLAITWMDAVKQDWKVATSYISPSVYTESAVKYWGYPNDYKEIEDRTNRVMKYEPVYETCADAWDLVNLVEGELGRPVKYLSYGPDRNDKE